MRQRATERALHFPAHFRGIRRTCSGEGNTPYETERNAGPQNTLKVHSKYLPGNWVSVTD